MAIEKDIYVIDAHNLLYKAHFAFQQRPLITTRGRDVSVAFGFTRMILSLLKEHSPEYIAMAFDRKAPTFRHELYKQYKLNRPPMPAPIADNIPDIKMIIRALGIIILEQDGYEADDILGTVVYRLAAPGCRINLITGDKDMLQLIRPGVRVLSAKRGLSDLVIYDKEKVIEKYGIEPERLLDFFSMMGDQIDNVPGIPGVGPKTAAKLLTQFESMDDMYERLDEIKSENLQEKIRSNREYALLSRKLIALKNDAEIPGTIQGFKVEKRDDSFLRKRFEELEFKTLIHELGAVEPTAENRDYQVLTDREDLHGLARRLRDAGEFAYDLETTSVDPVKANIVGMSFACRHLEAFYIPVGHRTGEQQALWQDILDIIQPVLADPNIKKIGQNIKYDYMVSRRAGLDLQGISFDTMVASYLIDPGKRQHNIDALALEFLNIRKIETVSLIGKGKDALTMDLVPVEQVAEYACEDADVTYRLYQKLDPVLIREGLKELFSEIEIPLIQVLAVIELNGVSLDTKLIRTLSLHVDKEISKILDNIFCMAGENFNVNSTQQLSKILFEKLGYPTKGIKKTKSGYSTAESELQKLVTLGGLFKELPIKLLEYRSLAKLKNTYLDTLPKMILPATGRVHTSFNQTVTETGRLSSSNPNLQNIPIRTEIGREIRKAFIPSEGNVLLAADYSQMELRILAHIADDASLKLAFQNNQDVHAATASMIFHTPLEQVSSEQRRRAKMVNFGIDYGMTPFGLSERLGISLKDAKSYIDRYLEYYGGVRKYIEDTKVFVLENGFVETLMGRRRFIPYAKEERRQIREMGFRQAINMRIQGTAADIIKIAMIRIYREMRGLGMNSKMILQVHDELVFDVVPKELNEMKTLVVRAMENAIKLDVPLKVDIAAGANWSEAH